MGLFGLFKRKETMHEKAFNSLSSTMKWSNAAMTQEFRESFDKGDRALLISMNKWIKMSYEWVWENMRSEFDLKKINRFNMAYSKLCDALTYGNPLCKEELKKMPGILLECMLMMINESPTQGEYAGLERYMDEQYQFWT